MIPMMDVIINGKEEQRRIDKLEIDDPVPRIIVPRIRPIPKLRHNEEAFEILDGKTIIINTYGV